jgi:4-amino-4-deoxy-L-arabinose transferase-like glycosyltransferase
MTIIGFLAAATSPYFLLLALAAGTALLWHRRAAHQARILMAVAVALPLGAGWGPIAYATLRPLETRHPPIKDPSVLLDSA